MKTADLTKAAKEKGWTIESSNGSYRVTDSSTGTLIAADWTKPGGYGLTLEQLASIIT